MNTTEFNQPADYKTYGELAEYARQRALHCVGQNDQQGFAHWLNIMHWASDCDQEVVEPTEELQAYIDLTSNSTDPFMQAEAHAFAELLRQMLVNRGQEPVPLPLMWLREAAKKWLFAS